MCQPMCMRVHINLDEDLVRTIDELAGERGRSAFIRDAVAQEAERQRKLRSFWAAVYFPGDFQSDMTAETISEDRKREDLAREAKLQRHWDAARHDDPG